MIYFCSNCKLNFKDKPNDDLCSDCRLTQKEKYLLFRQCIECIEYYNDPYHKCDKVKDKRKKKKKKKKKNIIKKPEYIANGKIVLNAPIGFA